MSTWTALGQSNVHVYIFKMSLKLKQLVYGDNKAVLMGSLKLFYS